MKIGTVTVLRGSDYYPDCPVYILSQLFLEYFKIRFEFRAHLEVYFKIHFRRRHHHHHHHHHHKHHLYALM